MESAREPTGRFTGRVAHYTRHRPGYPPELLELLRRELGLVPAHAVADVGSGTGKLSQILLRHGNLVYGIEPNGEMRAAAEDALREFGRFRSVAGTAEATGIEDDSVDLIAAAQAFHWFRVEEARNEFVRIGRPGSQTVLVWNRRRHDTPFLRAYESLLRHLSVDYVQVDHRTRSHAGVLADFFGGGSHRRTAFANAQSLDWEGLRGRLLSCSYVPPPGQAGHAAMLCELREIFDRHQHAGRVTIGYETEVHWGRLA